MAFRLEKLLNLRFKEEEALKTELALVRERIAELENELRRTEGWRSSVETEMRSGALSGTQVSLLLYLSQLYRSRAEELKGRLEKLREEERVILASFLQKRSERRSLEKLKERHFRRELAETERRERLIIDEVAIQNFRRSSGE